MKKLLFVLLLWVIDTSGWADSLRYTIKNATGDGKHVVLDQQTGLEWTYETVANKTWLAALAYCEELAYAGFSDWRLPNVGELASLVDTGKYAPASAFPAMRANILWSSSSYAPYTDRAWYVYFEDGSVDYDGKGNNYVNYSNIYYSVRCVRP